MKCVKGLSILMILAAGLTACGGDNGTGGGGTETPFAYTVQPKELASDNINAMITNGSTVLDDSIAGIPALAGDATLLAEVKDNADYLLFPYYTGTGKAFNQRMQDVYWSADPVKTTYDFQLALANGTTLPELGNQNPRFLAALVAVVKIGAAIYEGYQAKKKADAEQDFKNRVLLMGKTLTTVLREMREGFVKVNDKLDEAIEGISDLKGDMNVLKRGVTYDLTANLDKAITDFNGFMLSYNNAATITDASNIAYSYLVVSSDYWQNILNFINDAKTMQTWMVDNAAYSTWVHNDLTKTTNVGDTQFVVSRVEGGPVDITNKLWFENPKRDLSISVGNLAFLCKMMTTRLQMNALLYSGETLVANNRTLATTCLGLLAEFKTSANGAVARMHARVAPYLDWVNNDWDGILPAGSTFNNMKFYKRYYKTDLLYNGSDKTGQAGALNKYKRAAMDEYLSIFIAKLLCTEVQLKSYL